MITDTNLLLLLRYVNDLTNPSTNLAIREDLSYQFAYTQTVSLSIDGSNEDALADALNIYLRLEYNDLKSIPLHTHLWFVEQISARMSLSDELIGQLINLYQIVDELLLRHAIVALLTENDINWLTQLIVANENAPSRLNVIELSEILLDLRHYNVLIELIGQHDTDNIVRNFVATRRAYISGYGASDLLQVLDSNR